MHDDWNMACEHCDNSGNCEYQERGIAGKCPEAYPDYDENTVIDEEDD